MDFSQYASYTEHHSDCNHTFRFLYKSLLTFEKKKSFHIPHNSFQITKLFK